MRMTCLQVSAAFVVVSLGNASGAYANGATPIYSHPFPAQVAGGGVGLSLLLSLGGLFLALHRTGLRRWIWLFVAWVIAMGATVICMVSFDQPGGLWESLTVALVGLVVSSPFAFLWRAKSRRAGARLRAVAVVFGVAALIFVICTTYLRLSIDHWIDE